MSLSEMEIITVVMTTGNGERSYEEVAHLFNHRFPNRPIALSKSTVFKRVRRFKETGSLKGRKRIICYC